MLNLIERFYLMFLHSWSIFKRFPFFSAQLRPGPFLENDNIEIDDFEFILIHLQYM